MMYIEVLEWWYKRCFKDYNPWILSLVLSAPLSFSFYMYLCLSLFFSIFHRRHYDSSLGKSKWRKKEKNEVFWRFRRTKDSWNLSSCGVVKKGLGKCGWISWQEVALNLGRPRYLVANIRYTIPPITTQFFLFLRVEDVS